MKSRLAARIEAANATLIADGNVDRVGDFFTSDYVAHVTDEDRALGHDGLQKIIKMYRGAFTDIAVEVEVLVEGRERIAWQKTLRGTHEGPLKGFPPSGRPLVWREMVTSQFRNGLIAEEWVMSDLAERLLLARKP